MILQAMGGSRHMAQSLFLFGDPGQATMREFVDGLAIMFVELSAVVVFVMVVLVVVALRAVVVVLVVAVVVVVVRVN